MNVKLHLVATKLHHNLSKINSTAMKHKVVRIIIFCNTPVLLSTKYDYQH